MSRRGSGSPDEIPKASRIHNIIKHWGNGTFGSDFGDSIFLVLNMIFSLEDKI
jgi:hypothetical protein